MKKLLGLTLTLASAGLSATAGEAKAAERGVPRGETAAYAAAPQIRLPGRYEDRRVNRRGVRVVTRSRNVRVGRRVYRETYEIRSLPNGRTRTRLISRVRIR